jgi:hypothetical protein
VAKNTILTREVLQVRDGGVISPLLEYQNRLWRLGEVSTDTDDSAILQLLGQKVFRPTHSTTSPCVKSISPKTMNENNAKGSKSVMKPPTREKR